MQADKAKTGKVIVITGAGSGMGQLAAQNFSKQGAKVAALDVNAEGLATTAEGFEGLRTWQLDITDYEAVTQVVAEIITELGPIDSVYNAAAIMPFGKLTDQPNAVQHKIMQINFGELVNIAQATLAAMIARGKGDFVSFASSAALIPTMLTGAYSASKAAVALYTEILYHENINSGLRFACVCPIVVKTPLLQQARDTVWPKMLDSGAPMQAQEVLDEIESCLRKGKFWVYAGKGAQIGARMRRFFPSLIWQQVHKTEGF